MVASSYVGGAGRRMGDNEGAGGCGWDEESGFRSVNSLRPSYHSVKGKFKRLFV